VPGRLKYAVRSVLSQSRLGAKNGCTRLPTLFLYLRRFVFEATAEPFRTLNSRVSYCYCLSATEDRGSVDRLGDVNALRDRAGDLGCHFLEPGQETPCPNSLALRGSVKARCCVGRKSAEPDRLSRFGSRLLKGSQTLEMFNVLAQRSLSLA
jgi:hypothetical protein